MITGSVNVRREAVLQVLIRDADGQTQEIDVILDTGFNGSLTLPSSLIEELQLPWRTRGSVTLANGAVEQVDLYAATIMWDEVPRKILVEAANITPLLGTALVDGYEILMQMIDGGLLRIRALPEAESDL